ncbi:hypothetical protein ACIBK8_28480 [Streptomyces sp. NPDC050161]|uniref:hypothetical protein n=1 Tax=Streptomyces sp. NPDC050161 TaxID=3365604 RepID=UPI0037980A05
MLPTHPPTPRRRVPRPVVVLRALFSLLAVLLLAVGLPLLLWHATVAALPAGLDDLTHLFSRQDTTGVILLLLAAIGWSGWFGFVLSVAVEIPAQLRGRAAARLPGFRLGQRAAATLVGGILVLLPTGTAMASPAPAVAATAQAGPGQTAASPDAGGQAARQQAGEQERTGAEAGRQAGDPSGQRAYTVRDVRPAESLWSIAESELGSGELWTSIAKANKGRVMADGTVFHADAFLRPGWTLHLPARHTGADAAPQADGPATHTITVAPGQTLSGIAEDELGDQRRYPEIFDANRGHAAPGGHRLTDPDLIYPGQHLDIPAQHGHDGPEQRPHTGSPSGPGPARDDGTATGRGTPAAPETEPSRPSAAPTPAPSASKAPATPHSTGQERHHDGGEATVPPSAVPSPVSPKPSAGKSSPAEPASAARAADASGSEVDVWKLAGVGALLAASLAGGLGIKRVLQQRRRRAGETIAMPEDASMLEQELTGAAEPASVQLLDTALRSLHHHVLARQDVELPELCGARVTGRTVELLVDAPGATPLWPFTAGSQAGTWSLREDAELLEEDQARRVPAPWPGLVTLGSDPDGNLLLLNLPHTGTVLLDGEPDGQRAVARAIAMEAATCSWSDRTEILSVGLGDELAGLLPQGRLRAVPHLRAAIRDLGELLLEHHQAPADEREAPLPWVLICAAEASEEEAWDLAEAVAAARGMPIALVLPAARVAASFPEAEILHADERAAQPCAALGAPVILQHVQDRDYEQFVADLRIADEPARPAEGPWRAVPAPGSEPQEEPVSELVAGSSPPATASGGTVPFRLLSPSENAGEDPEAEAEAEKPEAEEPSPPAVALVKDEEDEAAMKVEEPGDPDAPEVQVLGPVTVTGVQSSGHGPKLAALAALVYFKPGRGAEALREAMDPNSPWSKPTLQARMSELRTRLGADAEGDLYLPRDRRSGYRLSDAVRCDWLRFQQLARRGLSLGPDEGIDVLESALALVRGRPFGGGDHAWAAPLVQEMISRIVDVAHTIATWRRTGPRQDLDAARRAVATGLDADDTAELLYQDWMRVEHAAGNRPGVYLAIETLQTINRRLDVTMEPETEDVIQELLGGGAAARGI